MFGLLNPALTPLKAKATLFAAGAVLVGALALGAACWMLWRSLGAANVTIGELNVDLENVRAINNANEEAWDIERRGLLGQLKVEKGLRALADETAMRALEREREYDRRVAVALRRLKESTDANEEVRDWSAVRVPDAVIDGMCEAARETIGETADCGGGEEGGGGDPAAPSGAVPGGGST